jgi:hypothetical protein
VGGVTGSAIGATDGREGAGSICTDEPAGGKPPGTDGADGEVGGIAPPEGSGSGCDVTGGSVEVETRPVGTGVKVG